MTATPKRVFDPMLPLVGHYRPIPDTEGKAFSTWLQGQFDEVLPPFGGASQEWSDLRHRAPGGEATAVVTTQAASPIAADAMPFGQLLVTTA